MTHCVLYAAKSTEDKHGSIPTQLEDCRRMAATEGWQIVDEFTDEGFSGFSGNRGPGLADARTAAVEHHAVLLAQHSDRFARGGGDTPDAAEHLAEIMFWARRNGVELRSVQDDASLTNPLLAFVMGERNFEDSKRKSASVASGMKRRGERGLHNGGPRKYGYDYVRDEFGRTLPVPWRIVEAEAVIVRRIFTEYLAGKAQQEIQRELNNEGITTTRGARWHQGTIAKMLADPFYAGRVRLKGELYDGEHEPLVSIAVFEQAAALRSAGAKSKGGRRGRPPKGAHLLTNGVLRCGRCGGAMVPRTSTRRSGTSYEAYLCYTAHQDRTRCSQRPVSRQDVDVPLVEYFQEVGLSVEQTREQIMAAVSQELEGTRALLASAEREEVTAAERIERVERDYLDGKLPADDWKRFQERLASEQDATRAKVSQLRDRLHDALEGSTATDLEAETLRALAAVREAIAGEVRDASTTDAVRAALLRLFSSFTYYERPASLEMGQRVILPDGERGDVPGISTQAGDLMRALIPHVRPEMIESYAAGIHPDYVKTPLPIAANNHSDGLQR